MHAAFARGTAACFVALLAGLLYSGGSRAHADAASVRAALDRAAVLEASRQPEAAARELETARKGEPGSDELLARLIEVHGRLGNLDRVLSLLRETWDPPLVSQYGPGGRSWEAGMAALARLGAWEQADRFLQETLQHWPGNYQALHQRVRSLVMLERLPEAIVVMESFPHGATAPPLYRRPGAEVGNVPAWMVYLAAGEPENALSCLPDDRKPGQPFSQEMAEADAVHAWLLEPSGEQVELLDRSGQRQVSFDYWLTRPPRPADTPLDSFESHMAWRRGMQTQLWSAIGRRYPHCFPAPLFHGALLVLRGEKDRGIGLIREAARMRPDWALPHRLLMDYYEQTGERAPRAVEQERVCELLGYYNWNATVPQPRAPEDLEARKSYLDGVAAARRGRWPEAAQILREITRYPYAAPAKRVLVGVLLSLGKLEEARELRAALLGQTPPTVGPAPAGLPELFPPVPDEEAKGRGAPDDVVQQEIALASALYPSYSQRVQHAIGTHDSFGTDDLMELLLQDAFRRAPRNRRVRTYLGLWLLHSPDVWPAGSPEERDADRLKRGRKLLTGVLKEIPGYAPATAALEKAGPMRHRR